VRWFDSGRGHSPCPSPTEEGEALVTRCSLVRRRSVVALWIWFFWDIWEHDAKPVHLNAKALYVSSAIGGILGTFFAIAMGVEGNA
jgi:hypothetical protein